MYLKFNFCFNFQIAGTSAESSSTTVLKSQQPVVEAADAHLNKAKQDALIPNDGKEQHDREMPTNRMSAPVYEEHSLTKRYTDPDNGYDSANGDDLLNDVGLDGVYAVDPMGYYNVYPSDADFDDSPIDKRHNSRWNLIHRKLAELSGNNKRDYDKRQDSRWLIIQNKLNQLHNRYSKRGIGRWRNNNWVLQKYGERNA